LTITSTIFGLASPVASPSTATTATTTSISVVAGDLLIAFAGSEGCYGMTVTFSDTGTSSSWLNATTSDTGEAVKLFFATRAITATESLTVTSTFSGSAQAPRLLVARVRSANGTVSFSSLFNTALVNGSNATIDGGSRTLTSLQYGVICLATIATFWTWTTSTSWTAKTTPNSGDTMGMFELSGAITSGSSFVNGAGAARQALAGVIVAEPIAYTYARPASDITTQWTPSTGTSHYALINEVTPDDANYIYATAPSQTDEVKLGPMTTPNAGTSVNINYRVQGIVAGASVTTSLYCNTTLIKADTARTTNGTYTMTVTSAEWASVADWTNMRIRFVSA